MTFQYKISKGYEVLCIEQYFWRGFWTEKGLKPYFQKLKMSSCYRWSMIPVDAHSATGSGPLFWHDQSNVCHKPLCVVNRRAKSGGVTFNRIKPCVHLLKIYSLTIWFLHYLLIWFYLVFDLALIVYRVPSLFLHASKSVKTTVGPNMGYLWKS